MRELKSRPFGRRRAGLNSFTLVEVVIAIAVCAFVLVSVLGLMAYSSQLVQQADNYSRLSSVSSQVLAQYNSLPFSVATNCATTNAVSYFNFEGIPTNAAGAYYQCNVTNATPSTLGLSNLMEIRLTICWPYTRPTNTNVIITSTLNYE